MKNLDSKQYRDDTAKELRGIRKTNPLKATEFLEEEKNKEIYKDAKEEKIKKIAENIKEKSAEKTEGAYGDYSILKKNHSRGGWSLVGSHTFYHKPHWEILVELNGNKKSILLSKEEYEKYTTGDKINLTVENWEREDYIKEVREKIKNANSFSALKETIKSIKESNSGFVSEKGEWNSVKNIINYIGDVETGDFNLKHIPKAYGIADKVIELKKESLKLKNEKWNSSFFGKIINKIKGIKY